MAAEMLQSPESPCGGAILRPVRPPLSLITELVPAEVLTRIETALGEPGCPLVGSVLGHHVELLFRREKRHLWSPWLSAEVHAHDQGARISGRFGPHPNLWTLFVALYAIWCFAATGALVYGLSQWTLDRPPTALWFLPLALLFTAAQYAASLLGQRLSARQTAFMRRFVRQASEDSPI